MNSSTKTLTMNRIENETMKSFGHGLSHQGHVRENNEDRFFVDDEMGLYIVCDGLGGQAAGEVAAQTAIVRVVAAIQTGLREGLNKLSEDEFHRATLDLIESAIHEASDAVVKMAAENPELSGMATTMTMLFVANQHGYVGHVGDSRLYLKHLNRVVQATDDHTVANRIRSSFPNANVDEEYLEKMSHVVTRSLGVENGLEVDTFCLELVNYDMLVLCTDGLSDYFDDENSIATMLAGTPNKVCDRLIGFALHSGGKDNITAVVVSIS